MVDVVVAPLSGADVRVVYPLMREAEPTLSLAAWLSYAQRVAALRQSRREGILVACRAGRTLPCGAVCYRRDHDLRYGWCLTAEHFIAVDLLDPRVVLMALLAELEVVAVKLGCTAIRSILHGGRDDLTEDLLLAGHVSDGVTLRKTISREGVSRPGGVGR